jgi:hypothetical protein
MVNLQGIKVKKMKKRKNNGGFSWLTFLGITAQKRKVSSIFGIPITKTGRNAKLGSLISKLFKW